MKTFKEFFKESNELTNVSTWGKVPNSSRITSKFRSGSQISEEELEIIQNQYEKFAKRNNIEPTNLINHIGNGNAVVWQAYQTQDYFIGSFIGDIFCISHFAPESAKSGRQALLDLLGSITPAVFAVPETFANQLERLGFKKSQYVFPMKFRNEWMEKYVVANYTLNEKDLRTLAKWYVKEYKPQLPSKNMKYLEDN